MATERSSGHTNKQCICETELGIPEDAAPVLLRVARTFVFAIVLGKVAFALLIDDRNDGITAATRRLVALPIPNPIPKTPTPPITAAMTLHRIYRELMSIGWAEGALGLS